MFYAPALHSHFSRHNAALRTRAFQRFVSQYEGFNVEQDEKSWTLSLDLPGLAKEDLDIGIEGAVVRIETKAEAKRQFKAAYELPQDIDSGASEAKLENGVLTLKLGKLVPVSNVKSLAVN